MPYPEDDTRDRPWVMRTYAGHSSAAASNALFRRNLAKGQTGLSVAFDLPTQTGYDPDDELARGEVGKVGVPVSHLGDMRALFDGIPLEQMNTSMTINAPAMWLLALYVTVAEEQEAAAWTRRVQAKLAGTTQNDIIKEYLSRGTYIFPPGAVAAADHRHDRVDGRRTSPSGTRSTSAPTTCRRPARRPVQEVAFALATAIAVLDAVRDSGQVPPERFGDVVARISFFVNAGVRFVEEMCKMRAFGRLWDEITRERYGVTDAKQRRFRYGVQVNSLGLTEAQPENNVQRIVLEMLGVTLSRDARARAVQLPAWNEALGLPRPWDQQWSLRMQQVLAYESDLLEYADMFEGSRVVEAQGRRDRGRRPGRDRHGCWSMGGAVAAVETGYMKSALVASLAARRRRMESGADVVVGREPVRPRPSPVRSLAGAAAAIRPSTRPSRRRRSRRSPAWRAGAGRRGRRRRARRAAGRREDRTTQPDGGDAGLRPGRRHDRRVGRRAARGVRRVPRADRVSPRPAAAATAASSTAVRRAGPGASARNSAGRCGCWSASPGWTGTPTAPSRSRCAPATPASRSSTRASG